SHRRCGSGRCGWCWRSRTRTTRNGRRSNRSRGRSGVRPRRCGSGCGSVSGTTASARGDDGRAAAAARARARESGAAPGERDPAEGVRVFRPGGARPPTEVMVAFIDAEREAHGVEPICAQLPIAPATYYAQKAQARDPAKRSARAQRVATLRGFVDVAFVIDVFARRIVGWRVDTTLRSDLALECAGASPARAPGPGWPRSPQRSRDAVPLDSLHGASGRRRP